MHVSHIPGRGLKNLALGWHGKNDKFIVNTKAGQGLLRKEFIMGKFRVVEHNERLQNSIPEKEIYSKYPEASKKWDELISERPEKNFGIEGKIDGEWYALA